MASPGKRRRKKTDGDAPAAAPEVAPVAPAAPKQKAKPKKKQKSFFDRN